MIAHGRVASLVPAAAIAALCACGISAFDDRQRHAWSDSRRVPPEVGSSDYAMAITTVDREQPGCTILVAGTDPSSLTTLSYDSDGDFAQRGLVAAEPFEGAPILAGALDQVSGGNGAFVVSDTSGRIHVYDALTGDVGPVFRTTIPESICEGAAGLGSAMVFGKIDSATEGDPDLLAVAGSELVLFRDVDVDQLERGGAPACIRCALPGVGAELETGTVAEVDGDVIFVLVDAGTADSQLIVLTGSQVIDGNGASCGVPLATIRPPNADDRFATPIAVGDVDENEFPEIAVASPDRSKVFVFRNVGDPAAPPFIHELTAVADSEEFGASLVFGDFDALDDDELEELAVGDPSAGPERVLGAGQVTIFKYDGEEFLGVIPLWDSEPRPDQQFGRALEVVEFGLGDAEPRDLLAVGAAGQVFTYFRIFREAPDPRFTP